jgi:UDP-GlcNAc:undecaprenyl-phosphate/decaprenyl-phosphate GlcNAc-1-phosphate transferase
MIALVAAALVPSCLVAWAVAYYLRRAAPRWGLVDQPGERKIHASPIPLGGGLAIWCGIVIPLAIAQLVAWLVNSGSISAELVPEILRPHLAGFEEQSFRLLGLLIAATLVMILGLADDLVGLSWKFRLTVQTVIAIGLVQSWEGWRITLFLDWPWVTGILSVVWIVWLINSFNMLDNMDGLSAGVAAIAATMLAIVVLWVPQADTGGPQLFVAGLLLIISGSLLGFLWHNRSPARIFMGDAGSYLIGLLIGATTLTATFSGEHLPRHSIFAPVFVLAIPLYDTCSVLLIRLWQGRSLFVGDNSHFSHRLVKLGLSQRHAVWTIYLAAITCGFAALVLHQVDFSGACILLALVGCLLSIIAILETAGRRGKDQN